MALSFASFLSYVVMIGGPFALVMWLRRTTHALPVLALWGALAYVASQVVHFPLLWSLTWAVHQPWGRIPDGWWLFDPIVLGLAAGLCEELARYAMFRRFTPRDRDHAAALMAGAGHGGVESLVLGLLAALTFINMVALRDVPEAELVGVTGSEEAARTAAEQLRTFWSTPWHQGLMPGAERAVALSLHVACSTLVALAVRRGTPWPLLAAIAYHAIADGLTVVLMRTTSIEVTELVLACTIPVSLAIIALVARVSRGDPHAPEATAAVRALAGDVTEERPRP